MPICPIKTQWNSHVKYIQYTLQLHVAIGFFCVRDSNLNKFQPTLREWEILKQLLTILDIFIKITESLSQANAAVFDIIPMIDILHSHLCKTVEDYNLHIAI